MERDGEAPLPRRWVFDLYARGVSRERPARRVEVPDRLHPAAREFAEDIGPVMEVLNAGTDNGLVTECLSHDQLPAALFHTERLRTTLGALAERVFAEVASEDWDWVARQLQVGRPDVDVLSRHLSEQYRTRNEGFDPDALVVADCESFTVSVTPEGGNIRRAVYVAGRVPGLFGALCDRDVPYFTLDDAKGVLLQQSANVMDVIERTTNSLLATAVKRGMPVQEIAAHCGAAQSGIESRLRTAESYANRRGWIARIIG